MPINYICLAKTKLSYPCNISPCFCRKCKKIILIFRSFMKWIV